jgi:hypothetical protein
VEKILNDGPEIEFEICLRVEVTPSSPTVTHRRISTTYAEDVSRVLVKASAR